MRAGPHYVLGLAALDYEVNQMKENSMKSRILTKGECRWVGLGLVALALALALAACTSAPAPTDTSIRERFKAYLDQCTAQYGYNPDAVRGVGEHELAPNERAWRECAYQGVKMILIPNSSVPDLYRILIAEDRTMTNQISAGTLTRQERRNRIEQLFAEIASEDVQMGAQEAARMRVAVDGLRR